MHLQHKAGTSDEQGLRDKGILKDLQSEKFLEYLDFMMDVTKVLSTFSKTFQNDILCITATLETTLQLLDELKLGKGPQYKKFKEGYCEETGILQVVSFAAVFRDVTQRSPERNGCSHSNHIPFPLCFKQPIKSVNCE